MLTHILDRGIFGPDPTASCAGLIELNSFKSYMNKEIQTFGEIWGETINMYIDKVGKTQLGTADYETIEEWQPFGDPTLKLKHLGDSNPSSIPPNKPNKPEPQDEENKGKVGNPYVFKSSTIDIDGDQIHYLFDWGDGTDTGYLGPTNSNEGIEFSHVWKNDGTYAIKTKAIDVHGTESEWSESFFFKINKKEKFEKFTLKYDFKALILIINKLIKKYYIL